MAKPSQPPNDKPNPWQGAGDDCQGIVELFESLRSKLILFFEVRRCPDPEEFAETTLERVIQKLCEGTKVVDLVRYTFGVAKNVFREYLRGQKAKLKYIEEQQHRFKSGLREANSDAAVREQRLKCLDGCLAWLQEQERWILSEYYRFTGQRKLEHRRKLAEQLNISREALTLRVFHIKRKLKQCISKCLADVEAQ